MITFLQEQVEVMSDGYDKINVPVQEPFLLVKKIKNQILSFVMFVPKVSVHLCRI